MPFVQTGGQFQGSGRQGDQAQVVAEHVVHVPGDPGPLQQSRLLGDQPPLPLHLFGALPAGPDQLLVLAGEPPHEPRHQHGEDDDRDELRGEREQGRHDGHGRRSRDERPGQAQDDRPGAPRSPPGGERGDRGRQAPPPPHQAQGAERRDGGYQDASRIGPARPGAPAVRR